MAADWTTVEGMLGKYPDHVIADMLGIQPNSVGQFRRACGIKSLRSKRISQLRHQLERLAGTREDSVIAKGLGISKWTVYKFRRANGIPAHSRKIEWELIDPHLGKEPDNSLALRFGASMSAIRLRRIKFDIPPFRARWTR